MSTYLAKNSFIEMKISANLKNHDYTVPAMHHESRFNSNVLSYPMNEPDQVENKKPHLVVGPVVLSGLTEFSVLSLANNQYL